MIKSAVLLSNTRGRWMERIAGTTVLERQLFTLARAGIQKVAFALEVPEAGSYREPAGLEISNWTGQPLAEPHLVVSGDAFFRIETIRTVSSSSGNKALRDDGGEIVLRVLRSPEIQEKLEDIPQDSCISLRRTEREDILTWLLNGVRKDSDGFMARYFDRNISLAVTRQLLDTWIRPTHMTIFSAWIGLLGATQFIYTGRRHAVAGSLLVWLHTVLDGCDGEMARLTFRESSMGAHLDFWGDNLVHIALFAGLAAHLRDSERWAPLLGTLACIGSFGSAFGSARLLKRNRVPESRLAAPSSVMSGVAQIPTETHGLGVGLKKLTLFLAHRDFIYLLVVCAVFNWERPFLWAAGLGAPLYLFILIYLAYRYSTKTAEAGVRLATL